MFRSFGKMKIITASRLALLSSAAVTVGAISMDGAITVTDSQCVGKFTKNVIVQDWYAECNGGAIQYDDEASVGNQQNVQSSYIRVVAMKGGPHAVLVVFDRLDDGSAMTYSIGLLPDDGGQVGMRENHFKDHLAGRLERTNEILFASPAFGISDGDRQMLINTVSEEADLFRNKQQRRRWAHTNLGGFNCIGFVKHVLQRVFQGRFKITQWVLDYAVSKKMTLVSTVGGRGIDNLSLEFNDHHTHIMAVPDLSKRRAVKFNDSVAIFDTDVEGGSEAVAGLGKIDELKRGDYVTFYERATKNWRCKVTRNGRTRYGRVQNIVGDICTLQFDDDHGNETKNINLKKSGDVSKLTIIHMPEVQEEEFVNVRLPRESPRTFRIINSADEVLTMPRTRFEPKRLPRSSCGCGFFSGLFECRRN